MTGRETEQIAMDLYESNGYLVYQPPHAKFREQDVFGLFDLLAFGDGRLDCIQIKGGRDASGIRDWFSHARVFEEVIGELRITFMHRSQDSWRVARTDDGGYAWVFDGRQGTNGTPASVDSVI